VREYELKALAEAKKGREQKKENNKNADTWSSWHYRKLSRKPTTLVTGMKAY